MQSYFMDGATKSAELFYGVALRKLQSYFRSGATESAELFQEKCYRICRVVLKMALYNWLPNALHNGATNWPLQSKIQIHDSFLIFGDVERSKDHRWQLGSSIQPLEDTWH
jgi:hypothetical protein